MATRGGEGGMITPKNDADIYEQPLMSQATVMRTRSNHEFKINLADAEHYLLSLYCHLWLNNHKPRNPGKEILIEIFSEISFRRDLQNAKFEKSSSYLLL